MRAGEARFLTANRFQALVEEEEAVHPEPPSDQRGGLMTCAESYDRPTACRGGDPPPPVSCVPEQGDVSLGPHGAPCGWRGEYSELTSHMTSSGSHQAPAAADPSTGAFEDPEQAKQKKLAAAEALKAAGNQKFEQRIYPGAPAVPHLPRHRVQHTAVAGMAAPRS